MCIFNSAGVVCFTLVLGKYVEAHPEVLIHVVLGAVVVCLILFALTVAIRSTIRGGTSKKNVKYTEFKDNDECPYTSLISTSSYTSLH